MLPMPDSASWARTSRVIGALGEGVDRPARLDQRAESATSGGVVSATAATSPAPASVADLVGDHGADRRDRVTAASRKVALRPQLLFGHSCAWEISRQTRNGEPGTLSLRVRNSSRTTPECSACGDVAEPSSRLDARL